MEQNSIQVQSILYKNSKIALKKALLSLANAVRINENSQIKVGKVSVYYGDASPEAIFTDGEIAELQSEISPYLNLKYEYFNENTGTAKGHNRLGKTCDSEYMLIMNPDVLVCPKFFELMLNPFINGNGDAGLTEARQTPVEHPKEYDRTTFETSWAATACALFKTETFREINGFDEATFFMYCDDLDFSWRIRLTGKKILYVPNCPVYHAKVLSGEGEWTPTPAEIYYSAEAGLLMAYKWSNDARVKEIYSYFTKSGDENLMKAAAHFDKLKAENKLPAQLDKEHKVAQFVGDNYAKHRFSM